MKNPTIAIRQADGSFYPIMSGTSAGRKRLLLTPAQDTQSGAKIELVRGEGSEMEDPQTFGTLHIDMTTQPEGDIELVLSLDEEGNISASAGLLGAPDRQELHGHLSDLVDQPAFNTPDLEEMDLSSLDELEDVPEPVQEEDSPADAFEFDLEEPSEPKTDRQILDDDSLVGDGLDDFSFGEEEEDPAGGPVQGEDLGDLGDLGSFDDFSSFEDEQAASTPAPESLEGEVPEITEENQDEAADFDLPSMEDLNLEDETPSPDPALEAFGDIEDLDPVQDSPLGDSRKSFEKGPEGFGLDLPFGIGEEDAPAREDAPGEELSSGDDFSFDDMEMGSLDDDFGASLDLNSGAGDLTQDDFQLDSDFSPQEDSGSFGMEIPPSEDLPVSAPEKKPAAAKGKAAAPAGSESVKVSGKIPLVLSLGTLVVLLGIFLGLLFLNMTRMTMVPPIQSLNLEGIEPVMAARAEDSPGGLSLPSGDSDETRRILSLEYFGTPHFYRQFPLSN